MLRTYLALGLLCGGVSALSAAEGTVAVVKSAPAGVSEKIAGVLRKSGDAVSVEGKPWCTIWWREEVELKDGFKPTLNVKYPFTTGDLLGVIEVQTKIATDFRGQEVKPGVYTLRYAQQPVDGNHVGTSELYDFLLAVPVKHDVDPARWKIADELNRQSATTAGSNHPAIFSMLPAEKVAAARVEHDAGKDLWILTSAVTATSGKVVAVRLVIAGRSE